MDLIHSMLTMDPGEMTTPVFVLGRGITALSAVQGIGRYSIPVYLLGSSRNDIAYHSRYATSIEHVDINDPVQVIGRLRQTAELLDCKPVLLCCSDFFLEMISAHRDEIQKFCHMHLPSTDAVATILDKRMFGDFCALHNLPAPKSWKLETRDQFEKCRKQARLPVAIKPVFSHKAQAENFQDRGSYSTMILARTDSELERYYTELKGYDANILIQEYIDGPDSEHYSYVSYRDSNSVEIAGVGLRKMRVYPVHAGVGTYGEVVDDAELAAESRSLLDKLDYTGISSVCFKRDASNNKLMLHEVNGRFPQAHSGSQLCGISLPLVAYQDALSQKVTLQRVSFEHKKWIILGLDFDAFRNYRRLGELSILQWLTSLWRVRLCAEFAFDDMQPFWFFLKHRVRRLRKVESSKRRPDATARPASDRTDSRRP